MNILLTLGPNVTLGNAHRAACHCRTLVPSLRVVFNALYSAQFGEHVAAKDWKTDRPDDWVTPVGDIQMETTGAYGPHPGDLVVFLGCADRYGYTQERECRAVNLFDNTDRPPSEGIYEECLKIDAVVVAATTA